MCHNNDLKILKVLYARLSKKVAHELHTEWI